MAKPEFKINLGTPLFYGGLVLPKGSVSGTFRLAIETYTEERNGRIYTRRKHVKDCIPYYITDFMPVRKIAQYSRREYYVFNINYWDFDKKRWINCDTDSSQRFWALEAFLFDRFECLHILNGEVKDTSKLCLDRKITAKTCGKKKCPTPAYKGQYGYMSKCPDNTMTTYDLVGDPHCENMRRKFGGRGKK